MKLNNAFYLDFVPWRFSNAGRMTAWQASSLPASENLTQQRTSHRIISGPSRANLLCCEC